jgi:hypothetical protein
MSYTSAGEWYEPRTIDEIILEQTPTADGWICPKCVYHKGGCGCSKGVFIAFVGANTSRCQFFHERMAKKESFYL